MGNQINKDARIRWIRASIVSAEMFPRMMSDMIINSTPPILLDTFIQRNPTFLKTLPKCYHKVLATLKTDGYHLFDMSLFYRCIRYFLLVREPSRKWGKQPQLPTEDTQGDDVERLIKLRNKVSHSPKAVMSKDDFRQFESECEAVVKRLDKFLNRPVAVYWKELHEHLYFPVPDGDGDVIRKHKALMKKYMDLEEKAQLMIGNFEVTIYYGKDVEEEISSDPHTDSPYTLYISGPGLKDEKDIVELLNDVIKNINRSDKIKIRKIERGSIILHVYIYKDALNDLHRLIFELMEKLVPAIAVNPPEKSEMEVTICVADFDDFEDNEFDVIKDYQLGYGKSAAAKTQEHITQFQISMEVSTQMTQLTNYLQQQLSLQSERMTRIDTQHTEKYNELKKEIDSLKATSTELRRESEIFKERINYRRGGCNPS